MKLVIDNREDNKRINSATRFFSNYAVKTDQLPIGDYLFDDKIVFEYKTMAEKQLRIEPVSDKTTKNKK